MYVEAYILQDDRCTLAFAMKTCQDWAPKAGGSHLEFLNKMALIFVNNITLNNSLNSTYNAKSYRILRDQTFIHATYLYVWLYYDGISCILCV